MAYRESCAVIRPVCFFLFPDSSVAPVCGDSSTGSRGILFAAGRRGVFSWSGQLTASLGSTVDHVELYFRVSKGDGLRTWAVLSRARVGPPRRVGTGGNAVDLMI